VSCRAPLTFPARCVEVSTVVAVVAVVLPPGPDRGMGFRCRGSSSSETLSVLDPFRCVLGPENAHDALSNLLQQYEQGRFPSHFTLRLLQRSHAAATRSSPRRRRFELDGEAASTDAVLVRGCIVGGINQI
jgi:hypothetical protein